MSYCILCCSPECRCAPPRPDRAPGPLRPWPRPAPSPVTVGWVRRRWRANHPLINAASVGLMLMGVVQVTIGLLLIFRG